MKNILYKLSIFVLAMGMFTSCDQGDDIGDINNYDGDRAIAGFGGVESQSAVFDPSQDTETIFTVGVSTISNTDRRVQIRVSDDSTLDPSFYTISTLTPVIPAGEFATEVTVTTKGGLGVPPSNARLILELVSVEDSEILDGSTQSLNYSLSVQCPSVDLDAVTGEGNVVGNELAGGFGLTIEDTGATRTVVAGPGENQLTIVGGLLSDGADDIIINVDPENGNVSYGGPAGGVLFFNGESPIKFGTVSGKVLSCISQIDLQLSAPFAAPFDSNGLKIQF